MNNYTSAGFETSDPIRHLYTTQRIEHWDTVSERKKKSTRLGSFYYSLLTKYLRFLVPENMRVLEIGCSHGNILAALNPSFAVGIDFSKKMIDTAQQKHPRIHFFVADAHFIPLNNPFDVIILSDLVNDLWDLQRVFEELKPLCHSGTRIILNFYNNLWKVPLGVVKRLGLGAELLEQNWFAPNDVKNLLQITGYDIIKHQIAILIPVNIPILSNIANRYLVKAVPFSWFAFTNILIARPEPQEHYSDKELRPSVSVIVPARNEAGNIESIIQRIPLMGSKTEIIFVEGLSNDNTYTSIKDAIDKYPEKYCKLYRQTGRGKGDAVRLGFDKANGDILMILDADMTVAPEDLPRFYNALVEGKGEFINGVRLVYPLENESMRFLNILGNKFFSLAFSWLLDQKIKDTLCGTKVLKREQYQTLARNRSYFGDFDPFGDFDLIFGASKLNLKIAEMPIRYRARVYGSTNIDRWRHGWLLIKMVIFASKRIKFI
jgi:SAM-dependent methyltransferase